MTRVTGRATTGRGWRIAAGALLGLLAATAAPGSGPDVAGPVYVFADPQGTAERAAMGDGRLPIVKGAARDALLLLDWRRLNGLAVGGAAADALAAPCCGEGRAGEDAWLAARGAVPGGGDLYWIGTERPGPNYTAVPTCFDDAFATAAATLADRARRYGVDTPAVRAWLAGQDAVFEACSKPVAALPPLPPALAAAAPAWLRADRAYQAAALLLYDGDAAGAAQAFAAIAADPGSPWRPLGRYLAVRSLARAALAAPSPARYAAAHAAVAALAAAPAGTYGRGELPRLARVLAYHEQPAALLARLDRDLNAATPPADIAPATRDYLTLADAAGAARPEAADWVRTVQAKDRAVGLAHAAARWRAGGRVAWLVAALGLVDPADPGAAALAAAAARVPVSDPAWLTARYHRLRLLERGEPGAVRAEADAALARADLALSDRNVLLAVRAQAAASLADFAAHALRRPYEGAEGVPCADAGQPAGDCLTGRLPGGGLAGLGPDARAAADRLPLAERVRLGDDARLPAAVRLDLQLTSYVRAVLLRDDAAADHLARRLAVLLPQVAADWARVAATRPGPDKLFAETFVLAKIPSARADLAGYARPVGATDARFAGYWADLVLAPRGSAPPARPFAPAAAYLPSGWWDGRPYEPAQERADLTCLGKCGGAPAPFTAAPFLRPLLARSLAERRFLQVRGTSYGAYDERAVPPAVGRSLWDAAFAWAAAHPADPRSPEALHRLIRVARWGANPDSLGRRAFRLLHARYPRSAWTRRSPFYYR